MKLVIQDCKRKAKKYCLKYMKQFFNEHRGGGEGKFYQFGYPSQGRNPEYRKTVTYLDPKINAKFSMH